MLNPSRDIRRFVFLLPAMVALLLGMWAGLIRLGLMLPAPNPTLVGAHGPLMVSGFLGTLIGVERAVGLGERWTWASPVLTGLGGLLILMGAPVRLGAALIVLGSLALVAVFALIVRRHAALHAWTMALATVTWFVGNLLWLLGQPIMTLVPWWAAYLILTIAGERLELSRLLFLTPARRAAFLGAVALFLAGVAAVGFDYTLGWRITGAGMIALAAWLLKNDIAWRTVRQPGLTRFIAISLLTGFVWLGAAGAIALLLGLPGPLYDAVLHAIFLGFVFAMIFGHAPVIFPAVLGVQMRFHAGFYVHLALLHASLLVRVIGDFADWTAARQWGGIFNGVALLLFLAMTVSSVRRQQEFPPGVVKQLAGRG